MNYIESGVFRGVEDKVCEKRGLHLLESIHIVIWKSPIILHDNHLPPLPPRRLHLVQNPRIEFTRRRIKGSRNRDEAHTPPPIRFTSGFEHQNTGFRHILIFPPRNGRFHRLRRLHQTHDREFLSSMRLMLLHILMLRDTKIDGR